MGSGAPGADEGRTRLREEEQRCLPGVHRDALHHEERNGQHVNQGALHRGPSRLG